MLTDPAVFAVHKGDKGHLHARLSTLNAHHRANMLGFDAEEIKNPVFCSVYAKMCEDVCFSHITVQYMNMFCSFLNLHYY